METMDLLIKKDDLKKIRIDSTYLISKGKIIQANLDSDFIIDTINSPFRKSNKYSNGDYFISVTLYIRSNKNQARVLLEVDYTSEDSETISEFYKVIGDSIQSLRDMVFNNFKTHISDHLETL